MYHPAHAPTASAAIALPAMAGKTLFVAGEPCEQVYQLRRGIARAVARSTEGDRQVTAFFFPGDEIGLPISDRYRFSAEAVTDLLYVCRSRHRWYEALMRSCREQGESLPSIVSEQDSMLWRGIILGRHGVASRVSAFLLMIAERLPRIEERWLLFSLPQIDIAAYLAISPESVCRTFRRLREMKLIAMPRRDRLAILDRERLKAVASGAAQIG